VSAKLQTVHVRVNDAAAGQPTPCRVRFTDAEGKYYAPFGRLTEFATGIGEDVGGNVRLGERYFAYIDGTCEIRLPAGPLHVDIQKGPEFKRIHEQVNLVSGQISLRFALERWVNMAEQAWYSGDCGVFDISPHAALLEASAEDVAVTNLLAHACRKRGDNFTNYLGYSNILEFSGQRPLLECPGHMVVVNTSNWHQRLGHLRLLNCHRIVYPLSFGAPDGIDDWSLADWCDQCHRKGGLVIASSSHFKCGEWLADLILGKVDAVEMGSFQNPHHLYPVLDEWNALLRCGYRVPLVGMSDKGSNDSVIGSTRTYAHLLTGQEFTYKNWIEAVRAGRTFVTNGPMLSLTVNGEEPGAVVDLQNPPFKVRVRAEARSLVPFERLAIVVNGAVAVEAQASGSPSTAVIDTEMDLTDPGWFSAYCWGEAETDTGAWVGGQTSPVYVQLPGRSGPVDAETVHELRSHLEVTLHWVEREARCETEQHRERLADIFRRASEELLKRAAV
jgi:hypothetical protein